MQKLPYQLFPAKWLLKFRLMLIQAKSSALKEKVLNLKILSVIRLLPLRLLPLNLRVLNWKMLPLTFRILMLGTFSHAFGPTARF